MKLCSPHSLEKLLLFLFFFYIEDWLLTSVMPHYFSGVRDLVVMGNLGFRWGEGWTTFFFPFILSQLKWNTVCVPSPPSINSLVRYHLKIPGDGREGQEIVSLKINSCGKYLSQNYLKSLDLFHQKKGRIRTYSFTCSPIQNILPLQNSLGTLKIHIQISFVPDMVHWF